MYESEEVMERKVLLDRIGAALFRVLIIIIIIIGSKLTDTSRRMMKTTFRPESPGLLQVK